jgi:hypothetical protein
MDFYEGSFELADLLSEGTEIAYVICLLKLSHYTPRMRLEREDV